MEKITSFTIDHLRLLPGVYVSRKDPAGDAVITTFDLRMTRPNNEPVMNTAEMHAIEHLGPPSCATTRFTAARSSTSAPWDAAPVSICCSAAILSPWISFL